MRVSRCNLPGPEPASAVMEKYISGVYEGGVECFSAPEEWRAFCDDVDTVTYAKGSEGELFPVHTGAPIGGEEDDGGAYYRLQVHYENPHGGSALDSSGIRIFYTSRLRQYDLGLVTVGHRRTPFLTVPPRQARFVISGHCSPECTRAGLDDGGVNVTSAFLHAHLRAKAIILRQIRDGLELEPIVMDRHYDFNYQLYRTLPGERRILPGDELRVDCEYDTTRDETFIAGGLSTDQEMCHAFMFVYPKPALVDCRSQPELGSYLAAMGVRQGAGGVSGPLLQKLRLPFVEDATVGDRLSKDDANVIGVRDSSVFKEIWINETRMDLHEHMNRQLDWSNMSLVEGVEAIWRDGPQYSFCGAKSRIPIGQGQQIVEPTKYNVWKQSMPRTCGHTGEAGSGYASAPAIFLLILIQCLYTFVVE